VRFRKNEGLAGHGGWELPNPQDLWELCCAQSGKLMSAASRSVAPHLPLMLFGSSLVGDQIALTWMEPMPYATA
jgi:hypothetical protein